MNYFKKLILLCLPLLFLAFPTVSKALGNGCGILGCDDQTPTEAGQNRFGGYVAAIDLLGITFNAKATADDMRAATLQVEAWAITEFDKKLAELNGYAALYDQIMADPGAVDWDDVARQLGLEPGKYTPDDLTNRLRMLKEQAQRLAAESAEAEANGMSRGAYYLYLRGYVNDSGNHAQGSLCKTIQSENHYYMQDGQKVYFTPLGYGDNCLSDIDNILKAPPVPPPAPPVTPPPPPEPEPTLSDNTGKSFLDNLRGQFPSIVRMIFALSYSIGVVFCIIAVMRLKHMGEGRNNSMSQHGGMPSILAYLLVGTALLYLPSTINMSTNSLLPSGDASLFAYSDGASGMTYDNLLAVITDIVKIVGLIAFVRGWIMLSKLGSQSQHGAMGKSLVHIIAGILAVNIVTVWEVARATFGYAW